MGRTARTVQAARQKARERRVALDVDREARDRRVALDVDQEARDRRVEDAAAAVFAGLEERAGVADLETRPVRGEGAPGTGAPP
jgi:hypothetical protein